MKWALALLGIVACDRQPPVATCNDNLRGVWVSEAGARWSLLDHGKTLEAFPLFDDAVPEGAPRVIDLARTEALAGEIKRRYMRGAEVCDAHAPIHVTKCEANTLQVVLADPQPPLQFAACQWPLAAPSRVERWRRE